MSTMVHSGDTPKLVIPALEGVYAWAGEVGYLLLRMTAGLMLIYPHVAMKLAMGPEALAAKVMAAQGIEPALPAAYLIIAVEILGIVCLTLGLLTRPVALLLVIEFLVIVKVHAAAGWAAPGGAEFPFLWLMVLIMIMLRGGGRYSLDRVLGREI
ncbi:MAG: DoxX family protein [Xanthobacteraceae bacterium]